jgi:hypothetical protein
MKYLMLLVVVASCIAVTSRTVVWQFVEQFWFEFVPVFHRLQGRLAALDGGRSTERRLFGS